MTSSLSLPVTVLVPSSAPLTSPPKRWSLVSGRRSSPAAITSLPPLPMTSIVSDERISMSIVAPLSTRRSSIWSGPALSRSIEKVSAPAAPLKRCRSLPSPPSTMSLPSPGSQMIVSLSPPPRWRSLPRSPSIVSLPGPPSMLSTFWLPLTVSLPAPALMKVGLMGSLLPASSMRMSSSPPPESTSIALKSAIANVPSATPSSPMSTSTLVASAAWRRISIVSAASSPSMASTPPTVMTGGWTAAVAEPARASVAATASAVMAMRMGILCCGGWGHSGGSGGAATAPLRGAYGLRPTALSSGRLDSPPGRVVGTLG
jgi:hypothetical protein